MRNLMLAWFFAVWGMSGINYHMVGPFDTIDDCEEVRQHMKRSIAVEANTISKCWIVYGR